MSVGNFLFSFFLPQKFNWKRNVVLAYNVLRLCDGRIEKFNY